VQSFSDDVSLETYLMYKPQGGVPVAIRELTLSYAGVAGTVAAGNSSTGTPLSLSGGIGAAADFNDNALNGHTTLPSFTDLYHNGRSIVC
jgi:hypothetical protein